VLTNNNCQSDGLCRRERRLLPLRRTCPGVSAAPGMAQPLRLGLRLQPGQVRRRRVVYLNSKLGYCVRT